MSERGEWIYTARERFTVAAGPRWSDYLKFSGFTHISELVTLDYVLCPDLIDSLIDADCKYNVQADDRIHWFQDCDYLIGRVSWRSGRDQILAIREEPSESLAVPDGFEPCGFDILDRDDSISVLSNCGQFPEIFDPSEVNVLGLIEDSKRAHSIAARIREEYPSEYHCSACRVWQLARRTY